MNARCDFSWGVLLPAAMLLLVAACSAPPPTGDAPGLSLAAALGDQAGDARFATVTGPPSLSFPRDHGPHPAYRQEWWYFTGHLVTPDGREFGYQVTFFRFALDRDAPAAGASRWHASQVYMAHLAVSDLAGGRHYAEERLARGALDLAGAHAAPLAVWVEDWRLDAVPVRGERLAVGLSLAGQEVGVSLTLEAARRPVLQGDDGYSQKGAAADNASAYYSVTRLTTRGELRVGDERYEVAGTSWFDREWGTSFLAPGVVGWDWFSLQLDDGRDLMFYRLRDDGGGSTRFSNGILLQPLAGGGIVTTRLTADDVTLRATDWWRSPETGVGYPVAWTLTVHEGAVARAGQKAAVARVGPKGPVALARSAAGSPGQGPAARRASETSGEAPETSPLVLEVIPALRDQELDLAARYWEGAVRVEGEQNGRPLRGRGYLELAGYE